MNKYDDETKKEVALIMTKFCEFLWQDFNDYYSTETSTDLDEALFDEMVTNISGETPK